MLVQRGYLLEFAGTNSRGQVNYLMSKMLIFMP
jgi:hypothetical protein